MASALWISKLWVLNLVKILFDRDSKGVLAKKQMFKMFAYTQNY